MATPLNILGFAGSLRAASWNRKILHVCTTLAPQGLTIEPFTLNDIPLFNQDVEDTGVPQSVEDFKQRIVAADGILICTPEYNWSVPGVLKNAIDWATRGGTNSWSGKPLAICGATPGMGGTMRCQLQLKPILLGLNVQVMAKPDVFISQVDKKFDESGELIDEAVKKSLTSFLAALQVWTARFKE